MHTHQPRPSPPPVLLFHLYDVRAARHTFALLAVVPEQHWSPPTYASATPGVAALMGAVLEEALTCFQRQFVTGGRWAQRLAEEAEAWFFSDNIDWLFSFVNICGVLDLDPEYIRLGLTRRRQQYATEPQKYDGARLRQRPIGTDSHAGETGETREHESNEDK